MREVVGRLVERRRDDLALAHARGDGEAVQVTQGREDNVYEVLRPEDGQGHNMNGDLEGVHAEGTHLTSIQSLDILRGN